MPSVHTLPSEAWASRFESWLGAPTFLLTQPDLACEHRRGGGSVLIKNSLIYERCIRMKTKTFIIHWISGGTNTTKISGETIEKAWVDAGYSGSALLLVDFYEEEKQNEKQFN